ncbi:hypothetical protein [Leptolyngbya sp. NIES-2104]|uniref:hypothetical protein n=1 Tax=Leptolyngbya sp. NIES-2104 TaxID=1552121 RepID=UPI0006ECCAC3|nr:hypothetical protein [Leptolyngbya sp. NIES-2104]GAP95301.1 hypothetical protein NIES2104_18210 [Leptolyngbya sp. NIES-2104]
MGTHQYTFLDSNIPPIPLLSVHLATPGLEPRRTIETQAILDTGSDCTLIPLPLLMQVNARIIGRSMRIPVAGNNAIAIPHLVGLQFDQYNLAGIEVFSCPIDDIGELLIIGRDLMNRYRIEFDGQNLAFTIF